jgi:hypothetical protein
MTQLMIISFHVHHIDSAPVPLCIPLPQKQNLLTLPPLLSTMRVLVLFIALVGVALCEQPPQFGLQISTKFTAVTAGEGTSRPSSRTRAEQLHRVGKYQGTFYQDMNLKNNLQLRTFVNGTVQGLLDITEKVFTHTLMTFVHGDHHVQKTSYLYESGVGCQVSYLAEVQAFQVQSVLSCVSVTSDHSIQLQIPSESKYEGLADINGYNCTVWRFQWTGDGFTLDTTYYVTKG